MDVHDAINQAAGLFVAGDARWQQVFAEAKSCVDRIDDDFSRLNAATRVTLFDYDAKLHAGDLLGADAALDEALVLIEAQEAHMETEADRRSYVDALCNIQINRAQVANAMRDGIRAERELAACAKLAPDSSAAAHWHRLIVSMRAASALATFDVHRAIELYEQAVELFRDAGAYELGIVLVNLAQAQLMGGQTDPANVTLERVAPLVEPFHDLRLQVEQMRAQLLQMQGNVRMSAAMGNVAELVEEGTSNKGRTEAIDAQIVALHASGKIDEAHALSLQHVADARADGGGTALVWALLRLAAVAQDMALLKAEQIRSKFSTGGHWSYGAGTPNEAAPPNEAEAEEADEAAGLHHAALAALEEVVELAYDLGLDLQHAIAETTFAAYVGQWHPTVDGTNIQLLHSALDRARGGLEILQQMADSAPTAAARRDFTDSYVKKSVVVAFDLAFRLGESAMLGAMIEERAARAGLHDLAARQVAQAIDSHQAP